MSSQKVRHFINNVTNFKGCRYLEVGCWKGSTLISALYKNPSIRYWAIDNWSEYTGEESKMPHPRDELFKNFKAILEKEPEIIEEDSLQVDLEKAHISGVNVYFYDGNHTEASQYHALAHYVSGMDDTFIFIVDDWNEASTKTGTENAIKELGLHAIYHQVLPAMHRGDQSLWWNGVGVYVIKKACGSR
jgi:hypothetical protein